MQSISYPIGKRIKDARDRKKLSQEDLAKRIGIKQQSLSKIEKGKSEPRESTLIALARELDDVFGIEWLNKHLPKQFGSKELAEIVNQFGDEPLSLQLDIFVGELALLNKRFRKMLTAESLKRSLEITQTVNELIDSWHDEDSIRHNELVKDMTERMNNQVQEVEVDDYGKLGGTPKKQEEEADDKITKGKETKAK